MLKTRLIPFSYFVSWFMISSKRKKNLYKPTLMPLSYFAAGSWISNVSTSDFAAVTDVNYVVSHEPAGNARPKMITQTRNPVAVLTISSFYCIYLNKT